MKETAVGAVDPRVDRTFLVGEELTMNQRGQAGREVLRDCWRTSGDIDGAHIIDAGCAEIIEILEDHPPTWDAAALTAGQITDLLAPHHPGAAEAAAASINAGLLVAREPGGLAIRTPAPERRKVGYLRRDYWDGNRFTKPYEAVIDENREWLNRTLDVLPPNPVAAAQNASRAPDSQPHASQPDTHHRNRDPVRPARCTRSGPQLQRVRDRPPETGSRTGERAYSPDANMQAAMFTACADGRWPRHVHV